VARQRVERRLVAILAADVAGYSRMMGADEEGTARVLREHRAAFDPIVAKHGGRIVKTTGDGVLIEFLSVVAAVDCAVTVQRLMAERNVAVAADKQMLFRIGVNVGDVLIEGDDILGDGVNIAARLEGMAEPGGICLSEDVHRQVHGKVDAEFVDLGARQLKNIARPMGVYSVQMGVEPSAPPTNTLAAAQSAAPRLSIVVLPFANLSGDKEQDYFVDGVTESLTTDLSRIPGAFVIARNTAFTFKSRPADAKQLGRELGVRYVLEGSMQSGDNRIRVNAQLIDTETGAHVWAERFDKPRADLFDMQDEIIARLTRTIGVELVAAEGRRAERERPNNMDAVDLAMRGVAFLNRPQSLENMRQARGLFEAALRLDESNVSALIGLAHSHINEVRLYASTNQGEQLRIAETAIAQAVMLAPDNAMAHHVRAEMLHSSGMPERALREFDLAISLDRNLAWAYAGAGFEKVLLGRAEETEAYIVDAMRLSPRDPGLDRWYGLIGIADLFLGKLDRAADHLRKAVELNPNVGLNQFCLAAALALMGRGAEASEACAVGCRLDPNFTIARYRAGARGSNPVYLGQRDRIYEGMRQAGVPEG
jgi:TolB-like protein/class 3 adenylate cyclase/Flp pilus assembly protein TadD